MTFMRRVLDRFFEASVVYMIRGHELSVRRPNEFGNLVLMIVLHFWSWVWVMLEFDYLSVFYLCLSLFGLVLSFLACVVKSVPKWKDGWLLVPRWMEEK